jgi:hypothetical protein
MTSGWADAGRDSFMQVTGSSDKIYFAPIGLNNGVSGNPSRPIASGATVSATGRLKITTHN